MQTNKTLAKDGHLGRGVPRVYSYTRFSSPAQAEGYSEQRQLEAAQNFAKEKKMVLDESLQMVDRGKSGFHGVNRIKGALGEFLRNVENGIVVSGSILLVENIDRLSREPPMAAMETVNAILKKGITIQTLSPRETYTLESANGSIWRLIAPIERAHEESKRKSYFAKKSWNDKRAGAEMGKILTARCPAWLNFEKKAGKFVLIPAAQNTIRQIFKLKLQGFGKNSIEKKLNEGAEWKRENGWRASYIEKILNNRAVIGEFQPFSKESGKRIAIGEPIKDYFPAIVERQTFFAVQKLKSRNHGTGGRTGNATNVFQNLVKCGYCGGSMVFVDKGKSPKGGKYLICDNRKRGFLVSSEMGGEKIKCKAIAAPYSEFENVVLDNLPKLRPDTVLLNEKEQKTKAIALRNSIATHLAELEEAERRQNNVGDLLEKGGSEALIADLRLRFDKFENKRKEIELKKGQEESELQSVERSEADFSKWQQNLKGLKQAIANDINARIRLKTHLKEFIERIEVFGRGHDSNVHWMMETIEDNLPELARAKAYKAFRRYFAARLLSAEGRCYRLHLRTNRSVKVATDKHDPRYNFKIEPVAIPLAPAQSLAESWTIDRANKGKTRFNDPKIKELYDAFFDKRKPGFVPKTSVV